MAVFSPCLHMVFLVYVFWSESPLVSSPVSPSWLRGLWAVGQGDPAAGQCWCQPVIVLWALPPSSWPHTDLPAPSAQLASLFSALLFLIPLLAAFWSTWATGMYTSPWVALRTFQILGCLFHHTQVPKRNTEGKQSYLHSWWRVYPLTLFSEPPRYTLSLRGSPLPSEELNNIGGQ